MKLKERDHILCRFLTHNFYLLHKTEKICHTQEKRGYSLGRLFLACILLKPLLELLDGLPSETGQARVQHQLEVHHVFERLKQVKSYLDQIYEGIAVWPHSKIGFHTQLHEPLEGRGLHPTAHNIHKFLAIQMISTTMIVGQPLPLSTSYQVQKPCFLQAKIQT